MNAAHLHDNSEKVNCVTLNGRKKGSALLIFSALTRARSGDAVMSFGKHRSDASALTHKGREAKFTAGLIRKTAGQTQGVKSGRSKQTRKNTKKKKDLYV